MLMLGDFGLKVDDDDDDSGLVISAEPLMLLSAGRPPIAAEKSRLKM